MVYVNPVLESLQTHMLASLIKKGCMQRLHDAIRCGSLDLADPSTIMGNRT